MDFEMDAEAIAVASLGQLKVIKVNYRGGGPSIPGNEDFVAVYRELLKTYKPKNIGMFGASGGCTLAQTTVLWLPQQKLPLPGAVGLGTCSGGSNPGDAQYTLNGLDAGLSTAFSERSPFGGLETAARKPGEPPATALDGDFPKRLPARFPAFRHGRHVPQPNGAAAPKAAQCGGSRRISTSSRDVILLLGESRPARIA